MEDNAKKIFNIDLCVSSKLYDLVAKTAKITLEEMGYKGISSILREICYSFKIKAKDLKKAKEIVETIVKKTSFFVNPNKDIWRIGEKKIEGFFSTLISYIENKNQERIIKLLKNQGFNMVLDFKEGELWHFSFLAPKKNLLKEIVVSKSISSGLLANLHSQKYKIL